MIETSYEFCEELTRREAGNFYHSFKYLPEEKRQSIMAYYAFCRRADDIADGDFVDIFPEDHRTIRSLWTIDQVLRD